MVNRFLRRLSVRQRIMTMVVVLSAVLALGLPLQVFVQRRSFTRHQETSQALADADRLVLLASVRVATSQSNLLRYLQGELETAEEALRGVNEALLRLDEANERMPVEDSGRILELRLNLADYQALIGQIQGAKLAGQEGEALRLEAEALATGDALNQRMENLVVENQTRLITVTRDLEQAVMRSSVAMLGVDAIAVMGALVLALVIVRSITRSIDVLRSGAEQLGQGHLDMVIPVEGSDELSFLAHVFNDTSARLARSYADLEQRVADRTHDLARRSEFMQAIIDVGRATTEILDADVLVQSSVDIIKERFHLYYVGLFLVDAQREAIVLRAGTGKAGRMMLARGHQLSYGQGMIGWSVANGQTRVSLEAEEDLMRFANPDLPDTRSEAALPLRVRGRVIGALTVQDDRPGAFDTDVVDLLQVMADHLAITIENAHLYTAAQESLESAQRAHGQMTHEGWMRLLQERPTGYQLSAQGTIEVLTGPWKKDLYQAWRTGHPIQADDTLAVPIVARGEVLGAVQLKKSGSAWAEREMALVQTIVEQVGTALESARLYQDTQRSVARERVARQITDDMRATLDWDDLMQTAVQEIGSAVQASRVFVQWLPPQKPEPPQKPITEISHEAE